MSNFGLDDDGFNRKRLEDIKNTIEQRLKDRFGEINLEPDSVFGQLVGVFSKPLADLWQELEHTYFSQYPSTAEGSSLDNAVDLIGISRLEATNTTVIAAITGQEGTVIPAGSQVEVAETGELFTNSLEGTITRSSLLRSKIDITTISDNTDYIITINSTPLTYESGGSANKNSIAIGLRNEINNSSQPIEAEVLTGDILQITTTQLDLDYSLALTTSNMEITERSSPLTFTANDTGPIIAPAGSFTEIVTPISGWDSVTNYEDGALGRRRETDQELRVRRRQSIRVAGSGSVEAIRSRLLQNVEGITSVLIFENRDEDPDNEGRPGHSFESVIEGGLDSDIADKLWELKPAGIETYGNTQVLIQDSQGNTQEINFSRPEELYFWVKCDLTIASGEFPSDGTASVAEKIVEFGNSFGIGKTVIFQQFFSKIYEVNGVLSVDLSIATSTSEGGPAGTYVSENISIGETQVPVFDADRVNVNIV